MTAPVRAYRILRKLKNYRDVSAIEDACDELPSELGGLIGSYRNFGQNQAIVWFFSEGIAVTDRNGVEAFSFRDIKKVDLPNEKLSQALSVWLWNGACVNLPIQGGEGKFKDSLEVLRFLQRVLADLGS
jgi:hypothetical protein